jgi:hypothetical protein
MVAWGEGLYVPGLGIPCLNPSKLAGALSSEDSVYHAVNWAAHEPGHASTLHGLGHYKKWDDMLEGLLMRGSQALQNSPFEKNCCRIPPNDGKWYYNRWQYCCCMCRIEYAPEPASTVPVTQAQP